jgi:hypothetical protein
MATALYSNYGTIFPDPAISGILSLARGTGVGYAIFLVVSPIQTHLWESSYCRTLVSPGSDRYLQSTSGVGNITLCNMGSCVYEIAYIIESVKAGG